MAGIKLKGRNQALKLHNWFHSLTRPIMDKVTVGLRFKGRVRLINRWGKKHPKRLMVYYSLFACGILMINLIGLFAGGGSDAKVSDPLNLEKLSADTPFSAMATVNMNRETIHAALTEYAEANIRLAQRFDSLYNLPVKTRTDSIELLNIYRKLYNNPTHNTHDSTKH